jgi:dTDP-4-dehydrorhamnose 3,5-epimerase
MPGRFQFHSTPLVGLYVIEPQPLQDARGSFERLFCQQEFQAMGLMKPIVQINHSFTRQKGAIRGMHFQYPPQIETKIVRCLRGAIFDVAVDIRASSPTFLHWHGEMLTSANGKMLYLPDGFAHGFQTLEDDVELLYLHTALYDAGSEGGLSFRDPQLDICWPLAPTDISERDQRHALIGEQFQGIVL